MVFSQSNNNLNSSSRADKVAQSDPKVCGKTAKYPYSKAIGVDTLRSEDSEILRTEENLEEPKV
jgi:hypothetical protein